MLPSLLPIEPPTFWTEAAKAALRQAIEDGLSASQAALKLSELFNITVTRSACLAKVYRMLNTGELTIPFNSGPGKKSGPRVEITTQHVVYLRLPFPFNDPFMRKPISPTPIILSKPASGMAGVKILDVTPRQCHWPISDDPKLGEGFMVHGVKIPEGDVYCDECKKFAFVVGR